MGQHLIIINVTEAGQINVMEQTLTHFESDTPAQDKALEEAGIWLRHLHHGAGWRVPSPGSNPDGGKWTTCPLCNPQEVNALEKMETQKLDPGKLPQRYSH